MNLTKRLTRRTIAVVTAFLMTGVAVVAVPTAAGADGHDTATYEITITNVTDGQYLTPPNWAAHGTNASVFDLGSSASPGVTAVAEDGGVPVLAGELVSALDDTGLGDSGVAVPAEGPPPIFPGASRTFTVSTEFDRLSIVAMIICTNDGFAGLDSKKLPNAVGQTKQYNLQGYDAGTELNDELDANIVPAPFCIDGTVGSTNGTSTDGVIKRHTGIDGVGNLNPDVYDWKGPVATISIERVG